MYCYANNFLGVITERETFRKAIDQLELFIVADNHMSETAQYADLVLPVTEWCEYTEVHGRTTLYPFLTLQEKAVDPLYESKCDWDIIRGIGTALGRADAFDMTGGGVPRRLSGFREVGQDQPGTRPSIMTTS